MMKNNNIGFTLIEVLISMVIFSIVIALAVMSYRFSFQQLSKEQSNTNVKQLSEVKLINQQIKTAVPYGYRNQQGDIVPFFIGDKQSFLFVTRTPILLSSPLAIAMVYSTENRIEYCEAALGHFALNDLRVDPEICTVRTHFMDAKEVKFEYFGWESWLSLSNYHSTFLNVLQKPVPQWSNTFVASERRVMPLFIRLTVKPVDREFQNQLIYQLSRVPPTMMRSNSD